MNSTKKDKNQKKMVIERISGNDEKSVNDDELHSVEPYLFLMEFFVHHISSARLAKFNQMFCIPTSLNFSFLNFDGDDVEVTPVDSTFEPVTGIAEDIEKFFTGCSILFAISTQLLTNKSAEFIINLTVLKRNSKGADIIVGKGKLDFTKQFLAIRKEAIDFCLVKTPPPQIFEGDVSLIHNEEVVGKVYLNVGMSTYGPSLLTEFKAPSETSSSSFIFKYSPNNVFEKSLTYKCHMRSSETDELCEESTEDLTSTQICQVCQPRRFTCSPCGLENAVLRSILVPKSPTPSSVRLEKVIGSESDSKETDPIQSSQGLTQPCGKAVVLKVSGLLNESSPKQPTVTVAPESEAITPDSPPDPDHDIFILRIGKKGLVGAGEKCDIQLEMKTPKGPERRPPIRYETREVQTDAEVRAKKGKGSKEKKKK